MRPRDGAVFTSISVQPARKKHLASPTSPAATKRCRRFPWQQGRNNKREREQYTTLTRQTKAGESITQGEYHFICLRVSIYINRISLFQSKDI